MRERPWQVGAARAIAVGERPRDVAIVRPCGTCLRRFDCLLEPQLVESLPLALLSVDGPARLALTCSLYDNGRRRRPGRP